MEKNSFEINANYHVVGTDPRKRSLFDDEVSRYIANNADNDFDKLDQDRSGTISLDELKDAANNGYHLLVNFIKNAYSIDKVPDNPTDKLANYKDSLESLKDEINTN